MMGLLRFCAVGLLAFVLAALVAFATVRYLTRDLQVVATPSAPMIEKSRILRSLNNELIDRCQAYAAWFESQNPVSSTRFRQWNDEEFRPGIADLRLRIEVLPYTEEAYRDLRRAAERVATMAIYAEDGRLRREALAQVRRASEAIEEQIVTWDTGRYLGEPLRHPRF